MVNLLKRMPTARLVSCLSLSITISRSELVIYMLFIASSSASSEPTDTLDSREVMLLAHITVTVISSPGLSSPSLAVRLMVYEPAVERVTVVSMAWGSAKVAVPGPLTWLQVVVTVPGVGIPSSLTVPSRNRLLGKVTDWSGPALTTGGVLPGVIEAGAVISYILPSMILGSLSLSIPRSTM